MKHLTILLIAICCCLQSVASLHEFHQYGLRHLTQDDGLANNTVFNVHQDKRGFLWIGTDVGISRYDGVHFHNYELVNIEPQSIKRICEMEKDNLLWLKLGRHSQIACFDKTNGKYLSLECEDDGLLKGILDICIADSALYAITPKGVMKLAYEHTASSIRITPETVVSQKYPPVSMDCDDNRLYILDQYGNVEIYNYRTQTRQTLNYKRFQTTREVLGIRAINGHLWVMTNWNGTYCYRPETDELRTLNSADNRLKKVFISDMATLDDHTIIASTPYSILSISFSKTDYIHCDISVSELSFDNFIYNSYVKNRITDLYVDQKNAVIWLATFGKGLLKSNILDKNINRIPLGKKIPDANCVIEDAHGYIWLSTEHHGIWRSTENRLSPDLEFKQWEKSNPTGSYCMFKDESGSMWIADNTGTIQMFNPFSDKIKTFTPKYDGVTSIGGIRHIYLCTHNRLWLVSNKGIFIYDYLKDECLGSYPYNDKITKITSLCEDRDGIMWLGTNDGIRNAVLKGKEIVLTNGREQKAGINKSEVLAVYMNRHNQMYISYTDKIIQTADTHDDIENIKILHKDIMSSNIECIIDDKSGNTWMGNNVGIMTINNKTKASFTYPFPERFYSVHQLADGRLLWCNSSGLMYFNPNELKNRSTARQLYISDIDINYNTVEIGEEFEEQVILESPIYQMEELVLEHSNNNINFHLTDLSYNQIPNKIEHRLLPIQENWSQSYKNEVEFSNLRPGSYTFEVRPISINNEDVPLTQLKITVNKHWSKSGIAFFCYLLFLGLFTALAVFYIRTKNARRNFYRQKETLLKDSLSKEIHNRKEEKTIYRLRNQARFNVAKELRTPLSLVTGPLKEMMGNTALPANLQTQIKVAYRNAVSMQDVCNLMVDIFEQEDKSSKLKVAPYKSLDIINRAISASSDLLNVTHIKLHFDKDSQANNEIWIDRKKIEYIFRNVLSNAYRHISYAGNISIKSSIETIDGIEYCCYKIKDDGTFMIKKQNKFVLSREEGGNELTTQKHADLGIILMKEYITAHCGDIHIEQDPEKGNTVTIFIPLGKEHFDKAYTTFVEPETNLVCDDDIKPVILAEEKTQQIEEEDNLAISTSSNGAKPKLLIIEDHKDIRFYLKVLFGNDYTIFMAENGKIGLKIAQKEIPDIILTDIMMPEMDGFEVTRLLKEDLKTCHIPIIMLTALAGDGNAVKGLDTGADDYILKPFNADILRSKVKRLVENRRSIKQAYMKLMLASGVQDDSNKQEVAEEGPKEDPFIKQIFEIVESNLQNPEFSVKRLAEMLNMSQPTLYRKVKMLTNYTIIELIRGVRLKNAAKLLRTKKYSIQEVSEMVGYNDAPTFRKHFVEFYGTTPSTYANKEEDDSDKKMM